MTNGTEPRIVAIGGGTGSPAVIRGLLPYLIHPVSICNMFDSGGSSGELRDTHGVLPPGDILRAWLAQHVGDEDTLRELMVHRLNGHSLGNLLTAAAEQKWGREEGLQRLSRLFQIRGEVWPVSIDTADLVAELVDGTRIVGETNIDRRSKDDDRLISRISLSPPAHAYRQAIEAIHNADLIVLGPGDFYTSVIPNLLVHGIVEALNATRARIVFVVNVMTKHGETNGYDAADFVERACGYGLPPGRIDFALVNTRSVPSVLREKYERQERAEPVKFDAQIEQRLRVFAKRVVAADLLSVTGFDEELIRHDPPKLGHALMGILEGQSVSDEDRWIVDLDDTLACTTRDLQGDPERLPHLTLADGAREFLEQHAGHLVLVTHETTPGLQQRKLEHLGIASCFEEVVVASGANTKALAIVDVIRRSGLPPENITVLGDRIDCEIAAGNTMGCRTIQMCLSGAKHSSVAAIGPTQVPGRCVTSFAELALLG